MRPTSGSLCLMIYQSNRKVSFSYLKKLRRRNVKKYLHEILIWKYECVRVVCVLYNLFSCVCVYDGMLPDKGSFEYIT